MSLLKQQEELPMTNHISISITFTIGNEKKNKLNFKSSCC